MRKILLISSFFLAAQSFATSNYWVHAYGNGWGSPENFSCQQAKDDAERQLDMSCRWDAHGKNYWLAAINHGQCQCDETSNDYFRCTVSSDADCLVID